MAAGPEAKKAATAENTEPPLKYKTWVLKVSVHCEGCKKKVKRILRSIDGVYTADVDLRQQKATVIGNVDADTLIKKLIKKTGKHAELWPEKADNNPKDKKKGKGKEKEKEKEKESDEESSDEEGDDGENEKEVKVKNIVVKIQDPSPQHGGGCHGVVGGHEGGGVQVTEVRIDEVTAKKPATSPGGGQSPVTDKKVGGECEAGTGGGKKKKKKKKKKKAHTGNNTTGDEGEHSGHAPAGTGSPILGHAHVQIQQPANRSPPRQNQVYEYPATTWYAPTVYAVSSSVAHPTTCNGGSYYAPPYSNACVLLPPSDSDPYPPQPTGSFEIFSDENPNACSVM
uniref:HMA domain-containing protein n=1 Tax=Salix viminalis TaxID=40686 RepID=A0A6N2L3T8_SALVM